jgi:lysophospholipase L1-like esterase
MKYKLVYICKMNSKSLVLFIFLSTAFFTTFSQDSTHYQSNELGDNAIKNVLYKAQQTGELKIALLGGSVSEGFGSDTFWLDGYAYHFRDSLRAYLPGVNIEFVNRAVSGTTSSFGTYVLRQQVFEDDVDLFIVEYSINDYWSPDLQLKEGYEGIVRKCYREMEETATIFLNLTWSNGATDVVDLHRSISSHYGFPSLHVRLPGNLFADDQVHPLNKGHEIIGTLLAHKIDSLADMAESFDLTREDLPPLYSDKFDCAYNYNINNIIPEVSEGWAPGEKLFGKIGWANPISGQPLEFEFLGNNIVLMYEASVFPEYGDAIISIDGEIVDTITSMPPELRWGPKLGWGFVAPELEYGLHYMSLLPIDTVRKNNIAVSGFELYDIMVSHPCEHIEDFPVLTGLEDNSLDRTLLFYQVLDIHGRILLQASDVTKLENLEYGTPVLLKEVFNNGMVSKVVPPNMSLEYFREQ